MRFYVEFKRPELGDDQLWEYGDGQLIPWTDEYKTLLQINKEYREWIQNAPEEKINRGELSDSIIEALKSITEIRAIMEELGDFHFDVRDEEQIGKYGDEEEDRFLLQQMKDRSNLETGNYLDLYPGLSLATYSSSEVSFAVVSFDTELDLDVISANSEGIEREDLIKLLPKAKWFSGYLDLPITMTKIQLDIEDNNPYTPWWYIQRDTYFYIAGIQMNVFIGGSKYFVREKEQE